MQQTLVGSTKDKRISIKNTILDKETSHCQVTDGPKSISLTEKIPASHILVLLFHKWQVEFHEQPRNGSGLDETVHVYQIVMMVSSQLESARICSSAFPIHQSSIHRAEQK